MKFAEGDRIKIVKPFIRMGKNHLGEIGVVTELRCYGGRYVGNQPTHYVVKFDCYKIPHIYMPCEIEESCEKIKSESMATYKADYSAIITMAGPVKFYKNQCPHSQKGVFGKIAMIGSSDCQMCPNFVKKNHIVEETNIVSEFVECNHEL